MIRCPNCGSSKKKKAGLSQSKYQRYQCKDCNRKYTDNTAIIEDERHTGIKDACNEQNVSSKEVKHGWLKSKEASLHFHNPDFVEPEFDTDKIDWNKIAKGIFKPLERNIETNHKGLFDRLVYTDTHIGMDISKHAQYGGEWNADVILRNLEAMIDYVISKQNADTLVIDDLGDFMDGWDGKTVRRKHDLPQNMSNVEAFETAIQFKIRLVTELSKHYKKIICHNVTEDNHSGDFGSVVNKAVKSKADVMFDNVEIINQERFMDHYQIGNRIFILCHGKDSKNLRYGFKPKLDNKGLEKIDNYIDMNYLSGKDVKIEFSKGDSHVEVMDKDLPTRFGYRCYPALSPASEWVQANYVPKDYGFYFFNFTDDGRKEIYPYYF